MRYRNFTLIAAIALFASCSTPEKPDIYEDTPFLQDYSVKYYRQDSTVTLKRLLRDRNEVMALLGGGGVFRPDGGQFQYPGTLERDRSYKPMADRHITDMDLYQGQLVFLDKETVFSNAFAGKLMRRHGLQDASILRMGANGIFVVSDGKSLSLFRQDSVIFKGGPADGNIRDIRFDADRDRFLILGENSLSYLGVGETSLKEVYTGTGLTCVDIGKDKVYLGTREGYLELDASGYQIVTPLSANLPVPDLTAIALVGESLWFGSAQGAFMRKDDGKFNYYYGERWLPGNKVVSITAGKNGSVWVLTDNGVGEIRFEQMTLEEKAMRYERQVRERHIRYGFNCDVVTLRHGDLSTFEMGQRDSDNLWTSMYLVSQLFRYKVTGDPEALQNCLESFEAMERLFEITGMKGYFARGFERHGYYKYSGKPWDGGMTNGWVQAADTAWDWRGTTSSDQTVGQMFSLTLLAELMDGEVRERAIRLMDELMTNIIENDWYLIDFDGKPTLWGKWNPEYVNGFPKSVGDRKLYSSNIIGFLQTAYHFTGKPVYKEKAKELMQKHGYLENLLRPISEIGPVSDSADDWAKMLSRRWNHSDDEMYFLAYWSLYPYAFDKDLKEKYREAIRDHWESERPEKNSLWNLCYAMTGAKAFDLEESIWHLKEFPLDMIEWSVMNSHRKDIEPVDSNFREQTIKEVLPPDERPELKHNRNLFKLDRDSNGTSELSAGDSFLLPYWMGRYLGVISGPKDNQ